MIKQLIGKSKKLKTVVDQVVTEDGRIVSGKLTIHMEAAGDLRMFVYVDEPVSQLLGTEAMRKWVKGSVSLTPVSTDANAPYVITGREPAPLQEAYGYLVRAYASARLELQLERLILVDLKCKIPGDPKRSPSTNGLFSFRDAQFILELSLSRVMRSGDRYFKWRSEEHADHNLSGLGNVHYQKVILPYTEELWAKLNQIQSTLADGTARLYDLVNGEDFATKLLSANFAMIESQK